MVYIALVYRMIADQTVRTGCGSEIKCSIKAVRSGRVFNRGVIQVQRGHLPRPLASPRCKREGGDGRQACRCADPVWARVAPRGR